MAELIQYVPSEIIIQFFDFSDIKTAVNFASCSKSLLILLQERIHDKEKNTIISIFSNIIDEIKRFHDDICSQDAKNRMLSFMLRRMIHTTAVYDVMDENDMSFHYHSKYSDEYHNLFLQVNEDIELNSKEFLTYMENAQFEYRGFNIIGLPVFQRNKLDSFKSVVERRYFSDSFKLQIYLAFDNNVFVEVIFDGENVEFDFHMRQEESGKWVFIDQEINRLNIKLHHVQEANRLLFFKHGNHEAVVEIINILYNVFYSNVKGNLVKGAEQTNVSIWNNMYEDNAVLAEAIHHYMLNSNIESHIHGISHNASS